MKNANFNTEKALKRLQMMLRIRAFELAAKRAAIDDKLVLGAIHLCLGQEAVATGVCEALTREDYILSTHRGHGHTLAKGANPQAMMMELLGRADGCCGGKGGSMHIADFSVGMLGANGVVSANITIAAGAAHAIRLRGGKQIVVCFFGDGAANRGPFLEGLNWAGVFDLPILFVCENNRYSASTQTSQVTSGDGPGVRAASIGLRVTEVDGNDITLVADLAAEITERIRTTGRPEFMHALTYRQYGHTYFDKASYRPDGEARAEIENNDPIARHIAALEMAGIEQAVINNMRVAAEREMSQALETARHASWPDDDSVFADIQDIGSPATESY